jgi:hypothetical protein
MNKETLEETAFILFPRLINDPYNPMEDDNKEYRDIWISGAKWKQEKMYSEEDMIRFAEFVATHPDKNRNVYGEMLHAKSKYDGAERTIDLLEQFKKQIK